jgi:NAD(P)-dependent dehydrogenase (short-subunit alcohol dehydrogenase family)
MIENQDRPMTRKPACLIVGAGAGNGAAIARIFGRKGFRLILASRRKEERAKLSAQLDAEGLAVTESEMDCADPDSVSAAIAGLGPIDALVYNAAAATMTPPSDLAPAQLLRDLTVNAVSALAAVQAVIPSMKEKGGGTILLTGGAFALKPNAALASLGMGKAAIRNLAFSLAEDLRPFGIRAGTVTILGQVKPGSAFDPDKIATAFWRMHEDRAYALGPEIQFSGEA